MPMRVIVLVFGLAACWLARDLLVPIMLAMLLALLANPLAPAMDSALDQRDGGCGWGSVLECVAGKPAG